MTFQVKVHKLDHHRRHRDLQKSDYSLHRYSIDRVNLVQLTKLNCLEKMDAKYNKQTSNERRSSSFRLLQAVFLLMVASSDFLLKHI